MRTLGAAALALFLGGPWSCGSAPPPQRTVQPGPSPSPSFLPAVQVPDTAAGRQLTWVMGAMDAVRPPAEGELAGHFTPEFLVAVPPARLTTLWAEVARDSPFVLESVTVPHGSENSLAAVVRGAHGPPLNVRLVVDATTGHMSGLTLRPKVDAKPAASWDEATASLRALAPKVSFLAAELDGGKCAPIASLDPATPLALGSAFKLYVLDALATQIAAGKHGWDEPVPIQESLKSLPSGAMRDEAAGKTFSVRHFAEQMISVSDNTAADHLLMLVGRPLVEAAVQTTGHAAPQLLQPFLTTREMFALKLIASADERAAYIAADTPHKRELLQGYAARDLKLAMANAGAFKKPVSIASIEWLASAEDMCKLMLDLHAKGDVPVTAPVRAILSINPGVPDENKLFSYIGFKGGSEPGVLNLTWLLRRARDGKWLFFSVGLNDTTAAIDEAKAISAVAGVRELLGK